MSDWLTETARTRSRNRVVAWRLALALALLAAATEPRYLLTYIGGPRPLHPSDLGAAAAAGAGGTHAVYWVPLEGAHAFASWYRERQTARGPRRTVLANLYAVRVGERMLVCQTPAGWPRFMARGFEGVLVPLPGEVGDYFRRQAGHEGVALYPVMLDETWFRLPGHVALLVAAALVLLARRTYGPALEHWRDPSRHPAVERVRSWSDPALAAAVEVEFRAPVLRAYGRWRVGDRFLIRSTLFSFDVLRWSDVLWAFRRAARWFSHSFVRGDHAAVLVSRDGQAQLEHDREGAEAIVRMAARRVPWAVVGNSKEVRREVRANWEGFVSRIEARRQEMERESAHGVG